jgi:ABC-type polysaccharide/polyol phosphate export permease
VRLQELTSSRELLWNLTLRELRGKYRRSALGWTWSLLNPLATTVMYTFVFAVVLDAQGPVGEPSGLHVYAFFLLAGLLPWTFFVTGTTQAMAAVVANGGLVKKVWFPREVLVHSTVLAATVSLLIELGLLSVILVAFGNMVVPWIPVLLVLVALLALFTIGLALALAACNVYFRDLTYLWGIVSQLWFFATPIIYPATLLPASLQWLPRINPMYAFVSAFRDVLYDLRFPTALTWAKILLTVAVSLGIGSWVFGRLSPRFAEEL